MPFLKLSFLTNAPVSIQKISTKFCLWGEFSQQLNLHVCRDLSLPLFSSYLLSLFCLVSSFSVYVLVVASSFWCSSLKMMLVRSQYCSSRAVLKKTCPPQNFSGATKGQEKIELFISLSSNVINNSDNAKNSFEFHPGRKLITPQNLQHPTLHSSCASQPEPPPTQSIVVPSVCACVCPQPLLSANPKTPPPNPDPTQKPTKNVQTTSTPRQNHSKPLSIMLQPSKKSQTPVKQIAKPQKHLSLL